jgi:hypothetical protein
MKRALAVAVVSSTMLIGGAAQAEWSAGAGFENFRWKETTTPTVKETGLRWVLDLNYAQSKAPGISAGYNLKLYNGNVDYDGAGLFTGIPISSETHYRGVSNEVQAFYRTPNMVDFMIAAGWDRWRRKLSVAQQEDWDVLYARAGITVNSAVKQGIIGSLGVKYPLYTRENANFADLGATNNPRLKPGKGVSVYGSLGYRVNPSWDVYGYYDSFRFKASNTVAVQFPAGTGSFFQPESKMDVVGMKVQYNFQ